LCALLSHSCYMPWPSRPPSLHYANYTWQTVQVMKLYVQFFQPITSFLFGSIFFSVCSQTPSVYVPPLML
jgi:hypothetical protein